LIPEETILCIGRHAPIFDGHFPGDPIVPGAKLLDLVIAALRNGDDRWRDRAIEITAAKFLAPVRPDQRVTLSWTRSTPGLLEFACLVGQTLVCKGVLKPADRPEQNPNGSAGNGAGGG
jgi:3-hydroxyacyl-[acyl-carrier-protein] dehydratase